MDEFDLDGSQTQEFEEWQDLSNQLWSASDGVSDVGDDLWQADQTYEALTYYQASEALESLSAEAYENAWEAYMGPVNAEGYTAYDASHGYTTSDTSLIEPASAAGSASLISDNSGASNL